MVGRFRYRHEFALPMRELLYGIYGNRQSGSLEIAIQPESEEQDMEERKKLRLIRIVIIIAITGILAVFVVRGFIAYRDDSYCMGVEQDAHFVLAMMECYMSEPKNRSCTDYDILIAHSTCGSIMSNKPKVSIKQTGFGENAWWAVSVTDITSRCPRGGCYTAYIGTDSPEVWK